MSVLLVVVLGLIALAIPFIFVVALVVAAIRRQSRSQRPPAKAYRRRPHTRGAYTSTPYYYGDTGSSDSNCNDSGAWGSSGSSGDSGSNWSSDSGSSWGGGDSGGFSGGGDSGSSSC